MIEFKSLDDTALPLPENSVLEFLSLATTTDVNTNFYRLVFSSLGSEVASLVFLGRTPSILMVNSGQRIACSDFRI